MTGEVLMPLNELRTVFPEAYAEHVGKYKGRENLLEERIPILECLWNDVLHLSPINPQTIIETWRREKMDSYARKPATVEVYKIPASLLRESTTVCFQSYNFNFEKYDPALEKYWKFQQSVYREQAEVESTQVDVWRNDLQQGRPFFWYSHTMHVLAKQRIHIKDCELILCR